MPIDADVPGNDFLTVPTVQRVRYARNFIKTAVCELRFPTLLELEAKAPSTFQAKLRKTYPFFERQVIQQVTPSGDGPKETRYLFRSKDNAWTVTLKASALALETTKYIDFADFYDRLSVAIGHARAIIDSDFFVRVGLRYINWIPIEDKHLKGWIRPELITPMASGVLGQPTQYASLFRGKLEQGTFTFRQSLKQPGDDDDSGPVSSPTYILDMDYAAEDVEFGDVDSLVHRFNEINFYVGSSRVDLQACKLEYSIVSPK